MAYERSRTNIFARDTEALPFFSLHPKTKIGTILRIALLVFIVITMIFTIMANQGLLFLWYFRYYFLLYIVPAAILLALIVVGLYKRMRSTFTRIAVPGLLAFISIAIIMTVTTLFSHTSSFAFSPKSTFNVDDHKIVFMRECGLSETENDLFTYRVAAERFSVRVPEAKEGEQYSIEGEILIPTGAEYAIEPEWVSEDTLRLFISKDSSGLGTGEITVKFASGETMPASPEASDKMTFKSSQVSPSEKHTVYFYSENSYIEQETDSVYSLTENDMTQLYRAYPYRLFFFADVNCRVEGGILVEPYSSLSVRYDWLEDEVLRITPEDTCPGASGDITIYFNEKAADKET